LKLVKTNLVKRLTTDEAELVPALAESLLLFGEVNVLRTSGTNSGHDVDGLSLGLTRSKNT
jgi:hypothetical protein